MKFLLIHQIFLSPKEGGGTRHFELARFAVQKGHHASVVASDVSYLDGKPILTESEPEIIEGVEIYHARTLNTINRSFTLRVIAFFSFMITAVFKGLKVKDIDIVMGTSPPLFQGLSAWMIAALRRKPFLMEIRDLWPDFAIDMGVLKNPVLIWIARRIEVFLYRRADHLLVNSPAYRTYLLEQRGIASEKVTVIANGVDPSMFDPEEKGLEFRSELGLEDKFVIAYTGAIGPANDLVTITRAAERLRDRKDLCFLIVGDGKDRPQIEKIVAEQKLENIRMVGLRPKSEMPSILAAADACLATLKNIPMFKTTYPNKIFDYMAAGRPIVLGIDGVIREVVEKANAGIFVCPGDDQKLAEAVVKLADDRASAKEMGHNGREYVSKHFNRACQSDEFVKLLENLIQNPA